MTVADFMREVQTAADMQTYYEKKNTYEEGLKSVGTDFERSQLRAEFQNWATVFKAGRPLVQEELAQGGKKAAKAYAKGEKMESKAEKMMEMRKGMKKMGKKK